MLACPARDLCADVTAYPHRAVVAAHGSAHVENRIGLGSRDGAGPDSYRPLPQPSRSLS